MEKGKPLTGTLPRDLSSTVEPVVMVIWDGPGTVQAPASLASWENRPRVVMVAYGYLGEEIRQLDEGLRKMTFITYPYGLSQDESGYRFDIPFLTTEARGDRKNILKKTYSLINVLTQALVEMRGNYYRDNFFDVIGMLQDQRDPLYERLSFGPGQRYASKGCYVVQLGSGSEPAFIKKSGWITR